MDRRACAAPACLVFVHMFYPEPVSRLVLADLNPAQHRAATYGDGPLLAIAGAGTGKTKTLAARVAYLIDQGVPPERILLLTFSRRAAQEMLGRAGQMVGRTQVAKVWGGTFHAVANRLLRVHGHAVGVPPNFTVLDQSDCADLMNLIRTEQGWSESKRRFPKKDTLAAIYSRTVNTSIKLGQVLETWFPWCADDLDDMRGVFQMYLARKREQAVLDYDDLLLFWKALLQAPQAGELIAGSFDHVLVDEYQDTNALQADILASLRRSSRNITVVGDDAQAIYSFRAATVKNILAFPERFPGAEIVKLEQNYRSTPPILAVANAVMGEARQQYDKELWSRRPGEARPRLVTCLNETQQAQVVCDRVVEHLEQGIPLTHQAVLFRTGHHSDLLEVELTRRNVPFVKYGGLKFIEAAHVKDMLAFLRILENPDDDLAWFRVLQLLDGMGPRHAQAVLGQLRGQHSPGEARPNGALDRFLAEPVEAPVAASKQLDELRNALRDARSLGPAQRVERLRRFYDPVFERAYDNAAVRVRDLEQLEQLAGTYGTTRDFITDLTLDPPASTSDLAGPPLLEEDYLILSTIHSAKGCEWDVVHVIHAADGNIPSDMATGSAEEIDEERRLFYVALTRAKDWLHVYFPLRYYHRRHGRGDAHSYAQLTRFISPAVKAHFELDVVYDEQDSDALEAEAVARTPVDALLNQLWAD